MSLGGILFSLLLSCNMRVEQEPLAIEMDAVPVCHSSKKGYRTSYESSVVFVFLDEEGTQVGKASGNYFKFKGYEFILTAAHVALAPEPIKLYAKEQFGLEKYEAKVIYTDTETDLAVVVLDQKLATIEPAKWKRKDYWQIDIGDSVYYTGHPMDMEYTSFNGTISKVFSNMLILQGWAYMGSSGSTVFDGTGRVVGVVSAIRADHTSIIPQMLPSIVMLAPLTNLSNVELYNLLKDERNKN